MTSSSRSPSKVWLYLSGIVATLVTMAIVALCADMYITHKKMNDMDDMATSMNTVIEASGHYIRDHHDALADQRQKVRIVTISGQTLQDNGYLPAGFSLDNPWHQHFQLNVTHDPKTPSRLTAFVLTTGGKPVQPGEALFISNKIDQGGAIIMANEVFTVDEPDSQEIRLKDYDVSGQQGHLFAWVPDDGLTSGGKFPAAGDLKP